MNLGNLFAGAGAVGQGMDEARLRRLEIEDTKARQELNRLNLEGERQLQPLRIQQAQLGLDTSRFDFEERGRLSPYKLQQQQAQARLAQLQAELAELQNPITIENARRQGRLTDLQIVEQRLRNEAAQLAFNIDQKNRAILMGGEPSVFPGLRDYTRPEQYQVPQPTTVPELAIPPETPAPASQSEQFSREIALIDNALVQERDPDNIQLLQNQLAQLQAAQRTASTEPVPPSAGLGGVPPAPEGVPPPATPLLAAAQQPPNPLTRRSDESQNAFDRRLRNVGNKVQENLSGANRAAEAVQRAQRRLSEDEYLSLGYASEEEGLRYTQTFIDNLQNIQEYVIERPDFLNELDATNSSITRLGGTAARNRARTFNHELIRTLVDTVVPTEQAPAGVPGVAPGVAGVAGAASPAAGAPALAGAAPGLGAPVAGVAGGVPAGLTGAPAPVAGLGAPPGVAGAPVAGGASPLQALGALGEAVAPVSGLPDTRNIADVGTFINYPDVIPIAIQQIKAEFEDLEKYRRVYANSGNLEGVRQIDAELNALRNRYLVAHGAEGIQRFSFGDNSDMLAKVWTEFAGVPIQIQNRTDGRYNVIAGGNNITRDGVNKEAIIHHARTAFDDSYRQQISQQQIDENAKMFGSRLKLQEKVIENIADMFKDIGVAQVQADINSVIEYLKSAYNYTARELQDGTVIMQIPGGQELFLFNPRAATINGIPAGAVVPITGSTFIAPTTPVFTGQ